MKTRRRRSWRRRKIREWRIKRIKTWIANTSQLSKLHFLSPARLFSTHINPDPEPPKHPHFRAAKDHGGSISILINISSSRHIFTKASIGVWGISTGSFMTL